MSLEDRLHNPLTEVYARRQYSQSAVYRAALRDPRFSSGFGMYPSTVKPKEGGNLAWLFLKFGLVGGLGLFLNEYVMYALSGITLLTNFLAAFLGNSFYLVYAILSSQVAVLVSFLMNERMVFRDRKGSGGFFRRMALFTTVSSADLVVRVPLFWSFITFLSIGPLVANFESILLTFTGRFLISEKKIWAKHH